MLRFISRFSRNNFLYFRSQSDSPLTRRANVPFRATNALSRDFWIGGTLAGVRQRIHEIHEALSTADRLTNTRGFLAQRRQPFIQPRSIVTRRDFRNVHARGPWHPGSSSGLRWQRRWKAIRKLTGLTSFKRVAKPRRGPEVLSRPITNTAPRSSRFSFNYNFRAHRVSSFSWLVGR